jgi:hypothetical protein
MKKPIVIIVLAQLFGTSLWFSANGAASDLSHLWDLTAYILLSLVLAIPVGSPASKNSTLRWREHWQGSQIS